MGGHEASAKQKSRKLGIRVGQEAEEREGPWNLMRSCQSFFLTDLERVIAST